MAMLPRTRPFLSPREVLLCNQAVGNSPSRMHAQNAFNTGRRNMPLFITYASYSHSGVKGLVNKPEDRSRAVKPLIDKTRANFVPLSHPTDSHPRPLVSHLI